MLPAEPLTMEQIQADPKLKEQARDPEIMRHLLEGHPGESFWHALPDHLRRELEMVLTEEKDSGVTMDGPCIWLDPDSRRCRHHEYRPSVCREFEIGSQECLDWRRTYRSSILNSGDESRE